MKKQQFCDFREMAKRYKSVRRFGKPSIAVDRAFKDTVKKARPAPMSS